MPLATALHLGTSHLPTIVEISKAPFKPCATRLCDIGHFREAPMRKSTNYWATSHPSRVTSSFRIVARRKRMGTRCHSRDILCDGLCSFPAIKGIRSPRSKSSTTYLRAPSPSSFERPSFPIKMGHRRLGILLVRRPSVFTTRLRPKNLPHIESNASRNARAQRLSTLHTARTVSDCSTTVSSITFPPSFPIDDSPEKDKDPHWDPKLYPHIGITISEEDALTLVNDIIDGALKMKAPRWRNLYTLFTTRERRGEAALFSLAAILGGPDNNILFSIAEIASLAQWKYEQAEAGTLDVMELDRRARSIHLCYFGSHGAAETMVHGGLLLATIHQGRQSPLNLFELADTRSTLSDLYLLTSMLFLVSVISPSPLAETVSLSVNALLDTFSDRVPRLPTFSEDFGKRVLFPCFVMSAMASSVHEQRVAECHNVLSLKGDTVAKSRLSEILNAISRLHALREAGGLAHLSNVCWADAIGHDCSMLSW
ncbi:uncharacterized protein EI90DRAFT_2057820 [Cantharellus anzutake]|uniref:uncharacterized protein n=1 Tax=Cantharellus anzutake TaxID=1750568 RepID=UPI0019081953|nr:uncharacterized protein EI90DRAFT_2057820 [Cantharellus anzutake]KAF8340388.1 hypothetical protein EI90DRAFT_2057820 [Cantharellus anzutake]